MPDDYKKELCAVFAAPLGPRNTPLCFPLCDCICQHYIRLHSSVLYHLQYFHQRLFNEERARQEMQRKCQTLPAAHKSIVFGFLMPLEYWLNTKDLYRQPGIDVSNDMFTQYANILMTAPLGMDYLALSDPGGAAVKMDKTEFNMRRK